MMFKKIRVFYADQDKCDEWDKENPEWLPEHSIPGYYWNGDLYLNPEDDFPLVWDDAGGGPFDSAEAAMVDANNTWVAVRYLCKQQEIADREKLKKLFPGILFSDFS